MNLARIRQRIAGGGFKPFALRTSDGKEYPVNHPEVILVGRTSLAVLDEDQEIQEVRCIFIELPGTVPPTELSSFTLHTRCAMCGESAAHNKNWQAEVWADIHEFEHARHRVRLFERARGQGLKEIGGWRG